VLHAVGGKNADQRPAEPLDHFVTVDYVDRMDLAYAAADLALCRSGAMTVAELSETQKKELKLKEQRWLRLQICCVNKQGYFYRIMYEQECKSWG
ncbi:MAG TPA: glycosyltransferase, partial [Chitinophagales bacterium]|nr:glycosyltransferase [Chitinophagales bacterium]